MILLEATGLIRLFKKDVDRPALRGGIFFVVFCQRFNAEASQSDESQRARLGIFEMLNVVESTIGCVGKPQKLPVIFTHTLQGCLIG